MADRARDLTFAVLSDVSRLDLDDAARDLERFGDEGKRALDRVKDGTDDAAREVRDFQDDARDAARRISDSFDDIARASRTNLRNKLDDDTDRAKESLHGVRDEAQDTGREMAASFSGSADDIMGALQELAANAGVAFGPIGGAMSIALGAGLGLFFADWQKRKEELKEGVADFTQALVEGQGKLSQEFLNQQIKDLGNDKLKELAKDAKEAGVNVTNLIRAYAGDPEAVAAVTKQVEDNTAALDSNKHLTTELEAAQLAQRNALDRVSGGLDLTNEKFGQSKTAYELMRDAMRDPVVPQVDGQPAVAAAHRTRTELETALGKTLPVPVAVEGAYAAAVEARNAMQRVFSRNPITVPVNPKPGQGAGYGVVRPIP